MFWYKGRSKLSPRWLVVGSLLLLLVGVALATYVIIQPAVHHIATLGGKTTPGAAAPTYGANIDFPTEDIYGSYSPQALANPNVDGVVINLNWASVQPTQGVYNFAPLDQMMNAWGQASKHFVFVVRYANESGSTSATSCNVAHQYLPAWEVARIPHFCDTDRGVIIPDYFDALFQHDLLTYVQAIATHVAASAYRANLLYVRIGVGLAGEGIPLMGWNCAPGDPTCNYADFQADLSQLVAYGYSPQQWEAWQERMLAAYQQAFASTTVIYPINVLGINPITGKPIQMDVAFWAAAHGFGMGVEGLRPVPHPYGNILPYIMQHYPNTYLQFQTIWSVGSYSEMQGDIQTASGAGARSVEWYESDITTASFQPLFQQWQQSVQNKYGSNVRKALPILRPYRIPLLVRDIKSERVA